MRRSLALLAVDSQIGHEVLESPGEIVSEHPEPLGQLRLLGSRELHRQAQGHSAGNVLRAWPDAELLATTVDDGLDGLSVTHDQGADSLGCTDLVARDGQQRTGEIGHRDRYLADRLHRIGVIADARILASPGNLPHRLNYSDLIVHPHDGDDGGAID